MLENDGKFEVISRACADTLNIIVTDAETLPTMVNEINMVVGKVITLIEKVEYPIFFEFLDHFVSAIDKFLVNQYILSIFDALIGNIVRE